MREVQRISFLVLLVENEFYCLATQSQRHRDIHSRRRTSNEPSIKYFAVNLDDALCFCFDDGGRRFWSDDFDTHGS